MLVQTEIQLTPAKGEATFERRLKTMFGALARSVSSLMRTLPVAPVRAYFRYFPAHAGKPRIWRLTAKKLWLKPELKARTVFGDQMVVGTHCILGKRIYYFGIWEPNLTRYVLDQLREGDVFIDVGANIGYFSILAGKAVGNSGSVVAIEALPQTFDRLRLNLELNETRNCRSIGVAAWNTPGEISLFAKAGRPDGTSTAIRAWAERWGNQQEFRVPSAPLASLLTADEISRARIIKIDVEGAEWRVLESMCGMMPQCRPDLEVIVELTKDGLEAEDKTCDDVVALFRRWEFRPYIIENDYRPRAYIHQRRSRPKLVEHIEMNRKPFADVVFSRRHADTL